MLDDNLERRRKYDAAERFVDWLQGRVEDVATGRRIDVSPGDPTASLWLGRLAPWNTENAEDDRSGRLEPNAIGFQFLLDEDRLPGSFTVDVSFRLWRRRKAESGRYEWRKSERISAAVQIDLDAGGAFTVHDEPLRDAMREVTGGTFASAEVSADLRHDRRRGLILDVHLVNTSSGDDAREREWAKLRLFEAAMTAEGVPCRPFTLEALPDSFRYDRSVPAWGHNCGVVVRDDRFETVDLPVTAKMRPRFWNVDEPEPDVRFETLAQDPVGPASALVASLRRWGEEAWSDEALSRDEADWSTSDAEEAARERAKFDGEVARIEEGVDALRTDERLRRAFQLMNEAIGESARGKYDRWRPFQLGFLLANLVACRGDDVDIADIVWFPTGGGKTETYLGMVVTTAFVDRLRGKKTGVTAWARFPLRLLSLQQTQRFANVLAQAELIRQREGIDGAPFGLGFFIGSSSTPNEVKKKNGPKAQWSPHDPELGSKCRQLTSCPFCRSADVIAEFENEPWRLEHRCRNDACPWGTDKPLPIWVVDFDIYRYLPTVVVGTLDKAASLSVQVNMRGFYGPPEGRCSNRHHGHTYSPRSTRKNGCLVPDCKATPKELPQAAELYAPSLRLQDELHLLRDSLGAVDAHYETLLDSLQQEMTGSRAKILGSSATLTGFERQCRVLYGREARVFPQPEPKVGSGFWARPDPEEEMRRFLASAPRGLTIEYALDSTIVALQIAIRDVVAEQAKYADEIGVDQDLVPFLVSLYGTNVVYGNTLRDLDAVVRSSETQWDAIPEPAPNVTSLTGKTTAVEVAGTLERLERTDLERDFADRIHVITASSMMSHGVDIDRLNVMVVLGLPLTTAEFIQATARVGRRWPSLVVVMHKIGRERDASVYRTFAQWVDQGDRFVEAIPITGSSRRVLAKTLPGIAFARIRSKYEPAFAAEHKRALWFADQLHRFVEDHPDFADAEPQAVVEMLGYTKEGKEALRQDVFDWYERFRYNLETADNNIAASDVSPTGAPMSSLRDVEEAVDVWGRDPS